MGAGPELPPELVPRVLGLVPVVEFFHAVAPASRQFSVAWYTGLFPRKVVVPDDVPSINAAINQLAEGAGGTGRGLVLVRPGRYLESVRVTQNCHLLGFGPPGQVVVEAPGWESALVFAGLGVKGFNSGEDACVVNMSFRCRNESMRGRCVYIVMGQPRLERCEVEGGLIVAGLRTLPQLRRCSIRRSRGSGLHFTDHCKGSLHESLVAGHGRHGALIDRYAQPDISRNCIRDNRACGIRIFSGRVLLAMFIN